MISRLRRADCDFPKMARTPLLQPQFGFKVCSDFLFWLSDRGRSESFGLFLLVNWSRKRAGSKYVRRFPQFKPKALIRNEVARPYPLHSASNAGSVPERWLARVLLVRPFAALVRPGSSCHLVRSHSAFAIVADGFNRTSFHGFLAKRLLLRGGRLLKHIGVTAVVATREISGRGFPAQVAVNALVIE